MKLFYEDYSSLGKLHCIFHSLLVFLIVCLDTLTNRSEVIRIKLEIPAEIKIKRTKEKQ